MFSLEKVAHLTLISVSIIAVYVLLSLRNKEPHRYVDQGRFAAGGTLAGVHSDDVNNKLVYLVISSSCRFCLAQADFYHKLVSRVNAQNDLRLSVVAVDSRSAVLKAFEEVKFDTYMAKPEDTPPELPRSITPTLIATKNDGKILYSHFGALSPADQETLFNILR